MSVLVLTVYDGAHRLQQQQQQQQQQQEIVARIGVATGCQGLNT